MANHKVAKGGNPKGHLERMLLLWQLFKRMIYFKDSLLVPELQYFTPLKNCDQCLLVPLWRGGCNGPSQNPALPRGGGTVGQEAVELICENARKTKQSETISLWPFLSTKMELILMKVSKIITFGQKTVLTLSMVTLAIWGHKTTTRAAKRLSTGKPNVSRVASGYGEDMTPLSQVRLTQKIGVI